jgi:lipoprotein-anchoring transpeptidase ErfK/SrfK
MLKKILIVFLIILGAVAIATASFEVVFADQLPYGIYIDGKSYPKANKSEVTKFVSESIANYSDTGITLKLGDKSKVVKLNELGVTFNTNDTTEEAFNVFSSKVPLVGSASLVYAVVTGKNKISLATTYDESKFKTFIQQNIHPFFDTLATDATLSLDKSPTVINLEKAGQIVNDRQLRILIDDAIAKHSTSFSVPMEVDTPDVVSSDLKQASNDADQLLARNISLVAGTKKVSLKREDIAGWLSILSESNTLRTKPDSNKIKDYLNKLAPSVNKKATNQIADPTQTVLTAGIAGLTLEIDKSVQAIMDGLTGDKKSDSIALVTTTTNFKTVTYDPQEGGTAGLAEGKYVEINLSRQKLYLYEGQNFVNSFAVSTGKSSMPTPIGTFAVQSKSEVAFSNTYKLYMPYWSAITADGQYGMHGLPYTKTWRETDAHIGTPVSHGCIRLGPGNDSYVFGWAPVGTPVFIHK